MAVIVKMVSNDLIGGPSGSELWLDDRRRSVLAGEVALAGIRLDVIGQLRQRLFRQPGVGVVAIER